MGIDDVNPLVKEMTKPKNLRRIFSELKMTFFPGWDKRNLWQVKTRRGLADIFASGGCDYSKKMIVVVQEGFQNPDQLRATLIHEMCHAILPRSGEHSKLFQNKLVQAAELAQQLGQHSLAEELNRQVLGCDYPLPRISFGRVLDEVRELLEQDPPLPLKTLLNSTEWEYDSDELQKRYPGLKKAVLRMKREIKGKQKNTTE